MTGQFVRSREFLAAARELAGMRLLASVSTDVSRLVLETVESLVTKRALVGTRKLVGGALRLLSSGQRPIGLDDGNSSRSHISVALVGS